MIIFIPLAAILSPLSSVNAAISIKDCSNDVSFKSAEVANSFEKVPAIVGWSVAQSSLPSPPANDLN